MKKSIPMIRERESEAFIPGNGREREFPLTPILFSVLKGGNSFGSYFGAGHITKSRLTLVRRATGCPKREGVKCDELAFKDKFRYKLKQQLLQDKDKRHLKDLKCEM